MEKAPLATHSPEDRERLMRYAKTRTFAELVWVLEEEIALWPASRIDSETKKKLANVVATLRAGKGNFQPSILREHNLLPTLRRLRDEQDTLDMEFDTSKKELPIADGIAVPYHRIEGRGEPMPPLVIVPGCFSSPQQLRDFMVAAAQYGGDVAGPDMPIVSQELLTGAPVRGTVQNEAWTRTTEAALAQETARGQKADLLGYSTGAASAVAAALANPEKVRKVILLNPIGLDRPESPYLVRLARLVGGTLSHMSQIKEKGILDHPLYQRFASGQIRQIARGYGELAEIIHTVSKLDLTPLLRELRVHGIEVTVVVTEDDKMFSAIEIEKKVHKINDDSTSTNSLPIGFVVLTGTHTKIGSDAQETAALVNDIRAADVREREE